MTPLRWRLLAAVAVAAGAALLHHALREPDPPVPAGPVAAAALPLALPGAAQVDAPAAPAASAARPPAASSPVAPAARPLIGSEGYGPHIEIAQAGSEAAPAWEAVQWLRQCASNALRRDSLEKARDLGIAPQMLTEMMTEADAEARRCQTVTAQHRALLPELAARAMRGGVPEAASAYAESVFAGDLAPAQRQEVADAIRRDARAGDMNSLLGAVLAHPDWGLSDAEKLAFLYAYGALPGHPEASAVAETLLERGNLRLRAPPTPEQQAAARVAGRQIIDQLLARSGQAQAGR